MVGTKYWGWLIIVRVKTGEKKANGEYENRLRGISIGVMST
jgi:hypothetical protein